MFYFCCERRIRRRFQLIACPLPHFQKFPAKLRSFSRGQESGLSCRPSPGGICDLGALLSWPGSFCSYTQSFATAMGTPFLMHHPLNCPVQPLDVPFPLAGDITCCVLTSTKLLKGSRNCLTECKGRVRNTPGS